MTDMWTLVNGLTMWLAGAVVAIGILLIGWMVLEWKRAQNRLGSIRTDVYEAAERDVLSQALRREMIRVLPDGRHLLREHPDQTIEGWLDRYVLHRVAFEAGGWITGMALIFTFFLIALVLAQDVGPAIQSKSGDMVRLSEAVRKMGAKFVVSMLGILMTIFHGACRSWLAGKLHDQASELSDQLASRAVVLIDYDAELNEQKVAIHERAAQKTEQIYGLMHAQHQELMDNVGQLSMAVRSLGSIEVSVRDIGSELTVKLQNVVKNDIVAGIRKDLEEVTDRLCGELAGQFATAVETQLAGVNAELQKIEAAIASQAHGQVEELLNKLGDAVSGGFTSESSRMKEALARFVEVVPLLEQQMRALIHNAGDDLTRRGAESARMGEALVGQLERVLAGIESQQRASAELGDRMASFVVQTEEALSRSVSDAQQQMAARSKVNLDELTSAVRSSTSEAAEVYRGLVKEVHDSAAVLRAARTETADSAQHLGQSAQSVREVARYVHDSMSALRSVSEALAANVEGARNTVQEGSQTIRESLEAVQQQQQFIEDLSARWPQLTRDYLQASNDAFNRVSEAWSRHVGSIEQSVSRISSGFTESASEFAGAVEELGGHVQELRKVAQGGAPARSRAT
jgi:hypothetical protein